MNASSNDTRPQPPDPNYRSHVTTIAQFTSLLVLGVIIAIGNLACIITFIKSQSLRRRSHYLIISLSVADFLVSGVVFMAAEYFRTVSQWDVKNEFVITLEFFDLLTGMSSILNLASISVERFHAIVFPFRHRMLRRRVYLIFVSFPWVTSIIQTLIDLIRFFYPSAFPLYRYLNVIIPGLALSIISISYIGIGIKIRRHKSISDNQNQALRDQKLTVTLLIVTLGSLVTWLPLQCFSAVVFFCPECFIVHNNVLFIMKFLQFCNSGINVFIYILRIPEFRKRVGQLICSKKILSTNDSQPTTADQLSMHNKSLSVKKLANNTDLDSHGKYGKEREKLHLDYL